MLIPVSGIQETIASGGELYTQGGKELSPKKRSEREKNKKMLFKWKNGSRDLPRERRDVSCRLGETMWHWDVLPDRGYGGQSMQRWGK